MQNEATLYLAKLDTTALIKVSFSRAVVVEEEHFYLALNSREMMRSATFEVSLCCQPFWRLAFSISRLFGGCAHRKQKNSDGAGVGVGYRPNNFGQRKRYVQRTFPGEAWLLFSANNWNCLTGPRLVTGKPRHLPRWKMLKLFIFSGSCNEKSIHFITVTIIYSFRSVFVC